MLLTDLTEDADRSGGHAALYTVQLAVRCEAVPTVCRTHYVMLCTVRVSE
jgi:hypothetical protein